MDIKKIVLAVALMLGMAAVPAQAINGLDLVKRALFIGGGSLSGLLSAGTSYTGYKSFKATNKRPSDFIDLGSNALCVSFGLLSSTTAVTSGILAGVLFYLGFKK